MHEVRMWDQEPVPERARAVAVEQYNLFAAVESNYLWVVLRGVIEAEIEILRDQLETRDDDQARGRIRALREVLDLPSKAVKTAQALIGENTNQGNE